MLNKKNSKWRIKAFLISMILLFSFIFPMENFVSAFSDTKKDPLVYIALGDSIATGYGLKDYKVSVVPNNSYTALIKKELEKNYGDSKQVSYYNWAKDGRDSSHLLKQLKELSEAEKKLLSQANVITISIGSNDLLLPFIDILEETFDQNQTLNSFKDFTQLLDNAKKLQKDLSENQTLLASCEQWSGENGTFQSIIKYLKEIAPYASLYVNTIYNPFEEVQLSYQIFGKNIELFDLGKIAEIYISKINSVFSDNSEDYTIIHLDKEFKAPGLTNVHIDWKHLKNMNMDPHPNALGHSVIAECVLRKMKEIS